MSSLDEINEIITVLCGQSATSAAILEVLLVKYPQSNWTLEQLELLLQEGKIRGTFLSVGTSPTRAAGWMVNRNALKINYNFNKYFRNSCNRVFGGYRGCDVCHSSTTASFYA